MRLRAESVVVTILFGYMLGEYSFESHESFRLVLFIAINDLNPCDSSYKGGRFLFDFMPGITGLDSSNMSFFICLSLHTSHGLSKA